MVGTAGDGVQRRGGGTRAREECAEAASAGDAPDGCGSAGAGVVSEGDVPEGCSPTEGDAAGTRR